MYEILNDIRTQTTRSKFRIHHYQFHLIEASFDHDEYEFRNKVALTILKENGYFLFLDGDVIVSKRYIIDKNISIDGLHWRISATE